MIADEAHVRTVGNLPAALGDAAITPHLRTAKARLKNWVGDTAYTTAETEAATLGSPRDYSTAQEETAAMADAEAYLTLAAGMQSWNTVMQVYGSNAAGVTQEGTIGETTYRYLRPDQLEQAQTLYVQMAEKAVAEWLTGDNGFGSPGPGRSFAYDDDGDAIDDNYPENKP